MTVKEFYKVLSAGGRVDLDLYEHNDLIRHDLCELWDAEVLFVKSWSVFHEDLLHTETDTHFVTRRYTLHFDLEVKQCRQILQ